MIPVNNCLTSFKKSSHMIGMPSNESIDVSNNRSTNDNATIVINDATNSMNITLIPFNIHPINDITKQIKTSNNKPHTSQLHQQKIHNNNPTVAEESTIPKDESPVNKIFQP